MAFYFNAVQLEPTLIQPAKRSCAIVQVQVLSAFGISCSWHFSKSDA